MEEIDILVTVKFNPDVVDRSTVDWYVDKLGEDVYNIGHDFKDLNVTSHEVERRFGCDRSPL